MTACEPCGPHVNLSIPVTYDEALRAHVTLFTLAFGLYKIAASSLFSSLASNLVVNLSNIFHYSQQAPIIQSFNASLPPDQTAGNYQTNQPITHLLHELRLSVYYSLDPLDILAKLSWPV